MASSRTGLSASIAPTGRSLIATIRAALSRPAIRRSSRPPRIWPVVLATLIGLAILSVVILIHGVGVRLVYRHFTRAWERRGSAVHRVPIGRVPIDGQITSARDLAILARAVIRDLPEYEYFMHIPSIRYGRRVTQNFNKLIGRYPGADGFKTGFICASGYNLVASATRNGKRLIAVVLGASSGQQRAVRAAQLLERGGEWGCTVAHACPFILL